MKMLKKSIVIMGFIFFMMNQPVSAATLSDVEAVLTGTPMANQIMGYQDENGSLVQLEMTYGEAILAAAMEKDVDPAALALHIKNATGGNISGNPLTTIYEGASYLASGGTPAVPPETPAVTYSTYKTTARVNYRTGAGTSYSKAGTLNPDTEIQVEDNFSQSANGYVWFRFAYNGGTYYIASNYVTKAENTPPTDAPTTPDTPSEPDTPTTPDVPEEPDTPTTPDVPDTPAVTYSTYKTTTRVNYRTGAGTSYSKAGTLNPGTEIQVENNFSQSANGYTWYRFLYNGGTYYIASNYVTLVQSTPPTDTPTTPDTPSDSDQNGKLTGWQKIDGTWYYYDKNHVKLTGWQYINGAWYYMYGSGAMVTGWLLDGKTWYYLDSSGAMVTGWIKLGNTWYYMKGSGAMATGWIQVGKTWYYMDISGAMVTGWFLDGKTWYYLDSSGAMLSSGTYRIDGKYYLFNASGAWIG